MIIKYKHEGNWGFIDGLTNVVKSDFDQNEAIERYNLEVKEETRESIHFESELPTEVKIHNEIFTISSEDLIEELAGYIVNTKCLLTINKLPTINYDYPAVQVIANLKDRTEFDKLGLICNDEVYLLNDEGVTIERLN